MPPTPSRSPSRPRAMSRAFPRMCFRPPGAHGPRRRTARRDGNSRCTHLPTCLSCSTPITARCASSCIAPTSPGRASSDPRNSTTRRSSREILKLRREAARLLGYANYAEVSLVPKMAQSPDAGARVPRRSRRRRPCLSPAATGPNSPRSRNANSAWTSSKPVTSPSPRKSCAQKRYAFSDQDVKQYFPEHKVLEGMFRVVETIYGIRIEPDSAETWHPDVRFFRIVGASGAPDSGASGGAEAPLGRFYLDPYARDTKRGGAWMDEAISRRRRDGRRADAGRLSHLQLFAAGRRQARTAHPRRRHHAVPRIRPRPAPPAVARRLPGRLRHPRRGVGRGRTAFPVHGELLLGMGCAAAHDGTRRYRRAAPARAVRQDAGREELPERHADGAPARILAVRHAPALRLRPGGPEDSACAAGRNPRPRRGVDSARVQPLPQ